MLAVRLEISASMTQLNTRVYAILETHYGRPKRIKKFAFTSVCVYNRLRVDGATVSANSLNKRE